MINNEPLSQAHKPATPYKKQNQHKKWKRGMDNRKNGRGAQAICRNNTNHDGVSDISKSPDSNVVEVASNLVGNYVQATVKNGAQFQGKLSETSTITYDHLELILKDACKIRHGHKKNDLAFSARTETLTINHGDLKDIVLVKPMKWKNVFKVNQEIGDNGARQERHLQQWQPTTELLEETSLVDSELNHSDSSNSTSTDIASWTQFTSNDFKEGLNTAKLDQSTPDFKDCEQKAIVHGNEIQQSSSSNAHVLEERSCIITNKTWDEDDHYVAANKNSTNDINGNTSHRPYKSSMKTHNPRKLQHNYKYQSHQHWQSNVLDQKECEQRQIQHYSTQQQLLKYR
ncbi:hypothetical protein BCR42DRAFT_182238 [Absidia repens]|uniref:Uncharacterized protein n=1 Tax=Absidia repens TaxID=90262 RepID=A0A1X2HY15_9FUNG|nr:hypothetical protein BCR42DRAFT_182238 [Absidia repens]